METVRALIMAVTLAFLVTGCATPSSSGSVYSRHDTRTTWDVDYGHVKDIDTVRIEGEATEFGKIGGGYVGYEVGRSIGHGGGNGGHVEDVAGAAGAIAGALVGSAVEKAVTGEDGYQITVELDGGRTIAIVQARDQAFDVGERVKVFSRRDGSARVAKL